MGVCGFERRLGVLLPICYFRHGIVIVRTSCLKNGGYECLFQINITLNWQAMKIL